MRVAIVCDWFLRYVAAQAMGLSAAGAKVLVICRDHLQEFNGDRSQWQGRIDAMRDAGVDVRVITGRTRSFEAMTCGLASAAYVRAWCPDIVHAHPSIDPWLHLTTLGFPLALTVHDPIPHPGQPGHGRVSTAFSDAWPRRADAFIVHGEALVAPTQPLARGRPIAVIPHGLAPSPDAYALPATCRILLFGRLAPYKGISILVRAMEHIWEQRPEVELMIAGTGHGADDVPEHPRITRIIGYFTDDELDEMLASATLVAAPYTEASQSGVVSDALARGIPTVSSNLGALADLAVEPGLLVEAGDPAPLARALLAYLDHGMELRHRVHAFATERLSWEAVGRRGLQVYPELARQSSTR